MPPLIINHGIMNKLNESIVVVSGLPRSGTSLAMQMLESAGLPVYTDQKRQPDFHNPKGYFEHAQVLTLPVDQSWVPQVRGYAVKVIHALIPYLPSNEHYKVIFMTRNIDEVVASQARMLESFGRKGGLLTGSQLALSLMQDLERTQLWMNHQVNMDWIRIDYNSLIEQPMIEVSKIYGLLFAHQDDLEGIQERMAQRVQGELYRNRTGL